jgi:hypothetical protein
LEKSKIELEAKLLIIENEEVLKNIFEKNITNLNNLNN